MSIAVSKSHESVVMEATRDFISELDGKRMPASELRDQVIARVALQIELENSQRPRNQKLTIPLSLKPVQIVELMLAQYRILNLNLNGLPSGDTKLNADACVLAVYQETGAYAGVYIASDSLLRKMASELGPFLTAAQLKDLLSILSDHAEMHTPQTDPELVAVNNGIFNTRTKELLPFTPEIVFTSKSKVDYVENAPNPVITMPDGTPWDVVSWVNDLSDDDGVPELLWEIMSAIVRPNVRWDQAAFFYSEEGNNGKGTLCELMRQLVGPGSAATIPIEDFSKEFMLTPLVNASAVIVDENNVGILLDKAAAFKAAVTGDVMLINRKFGDPFALRFKGMMVQCINEFFKSRDKSASFARRQLFIPFEKNFKDRERKYIKLDYLQRKDVLEHVLWRVLQMTHVRLSIPPVCEALAIQYEQHNDPVKAFWATFEEQFTWDLLPYSFLYDLYRAWMARENPGGGAVAAQKFTTNIRGIARKTGRWDAGTDAQTKHRSANRMDKKEPLIGVYRLEEWMHTGHGMSSHNYVQLDPSAMATFYRGLKRL